MASSSRQRRALPLSFVVIVLLILLNKWCRNKEEGSLREACDTGFCNTDIISFLSVFGHGRYWADLSGHPIAGVGASTPRTSPCSSPSVVMATSTSSPRLGRPRTSPTTSGTPTSEAIAMACSAFGDAK
uniref:Uncharacterized protein n=1 Tax=Oryza meridionalis TaxID=40149 RepID=A0A0E0EXV7_9ORYZ